MDAIEAISNVNFHEVHRTVTGVGMNNSLHGPIQGFAKLHGVQRCQWDSVPIDAVVAVVNNCSRASVALWDDTQGTDAKVGKIAHLGIWQHHPLALVCHVRHLFLEELAKFKSGFVWTALHGCIAPGGAPSWGAHLDRCAVSAEVGKVAGSRMGEVVDVRMKIIGCSMLQYGRHPALCTISVRSAHNVLTQVVVSGLWTGRRHMCWWHDGRGIFRFWWSGR